MPVNRNALIRYQTIDKCLTNRYRQWTLEDLIEACSDALYEYEGIQKGVSRRTIQADIQVMRSEKLGYNAPIEVFDNKYYRYSDPDYSITNIPLTEHDLDTLIEITGILKQFKGFAHFADLKGIIQKLEDKVHTEKTQESAIIDIDRNEGLKGLQYLDLLYNAILAKKVLTISYQSFKASVSSSFSFHPYLLKEYNNRWFVVGKKNTNRDVLTLALDRIHDATIDSSKTYLMDSTFKSAEYYKDVVGVTVPNNRLTTIRLFFNASDAPYVITKPLHHSQRLISSSDEGAVIEIVVKTNFELERVILGYGVSVTVLSPSWFRRRIAGIIKQSLQNYEESEETALK